MALTYSTAFGIVSDVFGKVHKATGLHIKYDDETTDGHLYAGLYQFTNDYISVGTKALHNGLRSNVVSYTDCLSMCKQCIHEYRHWQQRQMFLGSMHDPTKYGFLSMSFGDNGFCRTMARQTLIASEFSAYRRANQFVLSYERDAEEYAIRCVPDVIRKAGFPENLIGSCIVDEINRRYNWYGDRIVKLPMSAADDLYRKKHDACELDLPFDYEPEPLRAVSNTFLHDEKAQAAYTALDALDRDTFLVKYIAKRDPKVFGRYPIIHDEMPELSQFEKLQRQLYRTSHGLPDENMYDGPDL